MELIILHIILMFIVFGVGWTLGTYNEERKQKKRNIPILCQKLFDDIDDVEEIQ